MTKSPLILIVFLCFAVAAAAGTYFLIGGESPVKLPEAAFAKDTVAVYVIDLEQMDGDGAETLKKTFRDIVDHISKEVGEEAPPEMIDSVMKGIDGFAAAVSKHKIKSVAVTISMDLNALVREMRDGDFDPDRMQPPVISVLVQAGSKPDLVAIASDIAASVGEEMPADAKKEMNEAIDLKDLGGGWYAIAPKEANPMFRVPGSSGDASAAAKFNDALSRSAGGMVQFAMAVPEDVANTIAGVFATDLPDDTPEPVKEAIRSIKDMTSVSVALDIDGGIGVREYITYRDADAAKRMADAYDGLKEEWPKLMDQFVQNAGIDGDEAEMMKQMQASMKDMWDLVKVSRDGDTIEFKMDPEDFEKMIDLMMKAMTPALAGSSSRAKQREREAYRDSDRFDDAADSRDWAEGERFEDAREEREPATVGDAVD